MLKFIHSADIHLDAPLHHLSELYDLRQDDLRRTMRNIRDLVLERQADFWLIAGDMLEHHGGRRATALFLSDLFASVAPVPVCIAPGNHDPWRDDSFYQSISWPANVFWFTPEWGAFEFPEKGCVIYGWGFPQPHVYDSPLDSFPGKLSGYAHHLMVLHASVTSAKAEEHDPYAPVSVQQLADTGMDYIALGHIHKPVQFLHPGKMQPFAAYPGTPEALTAKEEGERCVLYGELDDAGKLHLEAVPVQQRQVSKRQISIAGAHTMEQVVEQIERELANEPEENMVYVTLSGERAAHFTPALGVLEQRFARRFFLIRFRDESWPDVDEQKLIAEGGVFGRWLALLADAEQRAGSEEERQIASLARKEALKRIGGSMR
ncbi:metallophosphoesterase family protein [Brevibacillus sp. TJ4]|uniref:metallophosphoesterase family protein n=1 Tax=Brevibacillus sp. TJ4 TaxID=3234853 RepID=UPI003BA2D30F